MPRQYRYLPAALLAAFGAETAHAAEKSQYMCTNGDLVRRVIVEVGDASTSLPCEVIYWKDQEEPGVRQVLWNARTDAAFCDGKASDLVDTLSNAGWSCSAADGALQANATPVPQPGAALPSATASSSAAGADLDAATTAPVAPQAPVSATQQPSGEPAQTTAALNPPVQPAPSPAPEPAAGPDTQTAAIDPSAVPNMDQLQSVIQTNLTSLNQTVDGDFQAQIGDFGDLNRDGIDDAVVFFNYESSAADFTQFVAAYLYNGQSYHLAATKPVGGTDLAVRKVEVEDIVDGSIRLRLLLNDAGQSEDRRAAMVLENGQLVEIQ